MIVKHGQAKRFGGLARLGISIVAEIILSTLLAPLRMWFHSKFVLMTLLRKTIQWNAQQRTASGTTWSEALRTHGVATLFASGWIAAVSWLNPAVFVWLLPVAIPLLLSIPLSVYSSRVSLGAAAGAGDCSRSPKRMRRRRCSTNCAAYSTSASGRARVPTDFGRSPAKNPPQPAQPAAEPPRAQPAIEQSLAE